MPNEYGSPIPVWTHHERAGLAEKLNALREEHLAVADDPSYLSALDDVAFAVGLNRTETVIYSA